MGSSWAAAPAVRPTEMPVSESNTRSQGASIKRAPREYWRPKNGRLSDVWKFLLHSIVASVGVSTAAFIAMLWVSTIGKALGNWQPGFLGNVAAYAAAGIALGYVINGRLPSRLGMWVWVPLFLWLVALMHDFAAPLGAWRGIWTNFFTDRCDSSECLYELLGTWPFLGSLGYSMGTWLKLKRVHTTEAAPRT